MTGTLISDKLDIMMCPACAGSLSISGGTSALRCASCAAEYPFENGVPRMFLPSAGPQQKTEHRVREFYRTNPFPGYSAEDSPLTLAARADRSVFVRRLNELLPPDAVILEAGCGTGQLSALLAGRLSRSVFGADMSFPSLSAASAFAAKHRIENIAYVEMNIFRPVFRAGSFDVVISNGVLHHTPDPFLALERLTGLLRNNGIIVIGLYNAFGRIWTKLRRRIYGFTGGPHPAFLDRRLADPSLSEEKISLWFKDQYAVPHESAHTFGEVLGWFRKLGLRFICSVPAMRVFPGKTDGFLAQTRPGTRVERAAAQARMFLSGGAEGGFFVIAGEKT